MLTVDGLREIAAMCGTAHAEMCVDEFAAQTWDDALVEQMRDEIDGLYQAEWEAMTASQEAGQ